MQLIGIYLQFRFRITGRENQQLAAILAQHIVALLVSNGATDSRDHDIRTLAVGQIFDRFNRVVVLRVNNIDAHFLSAFDLLLRNIRNDNASAKRFGYLCVDQAHGAAADNDNILHRLYANLMDTLHNGGNRFQEASFCCGDVIVDRNDQLLIHYNVISKAFETTVVAIRARAAVRNVLAVAGVALTAGITHAAERMHGRYLHANFEVVIHLIAHGNDVTGTFVAGSHREALVVTQTQPLLIVGGTNVVCYQFDNDVRRPYFGERHLVHLGNMSFDDNAKMNFVRKHGYNPP